MMTRKVLFPVCLFLLIVGILFLFTALVNQTDPKNADEVDSYHIYNDLPIIKASSAAYLLDPDFTVTSENFSDCADDFFKAPTILYFDSLSYPEPTWAIKDYQKAAAFSTAFHDVSLTQILKENFPTIDNYGKYYDFYNLIGHLTLYEQEGVTYIKFNNAFFCAEGDLVAIVSSIGESLKDYSIEIPAFEFPH
ncbi:MAG: hypothetical protein ACOX7K_08255 [Oscillospiraceae bacterium]|jgi:hypothetical protein